jgi:uncharacterized membrane protein YphA (DoxX/SURF4 family)
MNTISRAAQAGTMSKYQQLAIFVIRVAIGWHFLFEGLTKLFTPGWSSASYLETSKWLLSGVFHWIASNPAVLGVVDVVNIWAQIIIGLLLMLGLFTRPAIVAGMLLLVLYYVANPPFVSYGFGPPREGHYLLVDRNLIEFLTLGLLLLFPSGQYFGLDRIRAALFSPVLAKKDNEQTTTVPEMDLSPALDRRALIRSLASLPVLGVFGYALFRKKQWASYEERNLTDAMTGASVKVLNVGELKELHGMIPKGTIRGREFSRLILGGNLLSGYAHSRDLIYVSQLVKAYHHRDKIFATLLLAERCGVDTLLTNPILCTIIDEYWRRKIGKIQFISDCAGLNYDDKGAHAMPYAEYLDKVKRAIDYGAAACYIQGETADFYMSQGKPDALEGVIKLIQDADIPYGIGAHRIETIKACVDAGFNPDFWMKTLHHHNYWSARHSEWHDNMYCFNPDETIRYMATLPQPFIAFKVMAAGAIRPQEAFRYAFENGADFICAGMYDFQMVEDVNVAYDVLNSDLVRQRPWMA